MNTKLAMLFASAAMLAACGGGGGDDTVAAPAPVPAPPPPAVGVVPASVNASIANFIGYLASLVTVADATTEPLDITAVTPPLSETDEPTATP